MMVNSTWCIHNSFSHLQRCKNKSSSNHKCTQVPEVKIRIIIFSFLFVVMITSSFTSVYFWQAPLIQANIQDYFECEARGVESGCACFRDSFNSAFSIGSAASYLFFSNFSALLIVYVIDVTSLRKGCKVQVHKQFNVLRTLRL